MNKKDENQEKNLTNNLNIDPQVENPNDPNDEKQLKEKSKQEPLTNVKKNKTNLKEKQGNGGVRMGTTFAPNEIIKARELRNISQKNLRKALHEFEKLGIDFNDGLSGVMLEYDKYKALVDKVFELEEILDNYYLVELYKNRRTDLPGEEWIERKEGQNMAQFLKKR